MWFKNATVWNINNETIEESELAAMAKDHELVDGGIRRPVMHGFVPPISISSELAVSVMGITLMCFSEETIKVPNDILKKEVNQRVSELIEKSVNVDRHMKKTITDEVKLALSKKVLPKVKNSLLIIDRKRGRIIIGESSPAKVETITSYLRKNMGLSLSPIRVKESPMGLLRSSYLSKEFPEKVSMGGKCRMYNRENLANKVSFSNHAVLVDEAVVGYLEAGYEFDQHEILLHMGAEPTYFVTNEHLVLSGIGYPEYAIHDAHLDGDDELAGIHSIILVVNDIINEIMETLIATFGGEEKESDG